MLAFVALAFASLPCSRAMSLSSPASQHAAHTCHNRVLIVDLSNCPLPLACTASPCVFPPIHYSPCTFLCTLYTSPVLWRSVFLLQPLCKKNLQFIPWTRLAAWEAANSLAMLHAHRHCNAQQQAPAMLMWQQAGAGLLLVAGSQPLVQCKAAGSESSQACEKGMGLFYASRLNMNSIN